ncbi:MAG: tetratricopeptide repeat protein, partial [Myxococcota bacterium]
MEESRDTPDRRRPRSTFFGRAPELAETLDHLRSGKSVVLVGPPGVGKTRLAWELSKHWPAETIFVELADAYDADATLAILATSVDLPLEAPASHGTLVEQLARRIAKRSRSLFVLDNVEQLPPDGIELLRSVFANCPALMTSQSEVEGYEIVRLTGLADAAAVDLFRDRAARIAGHVEEGDIATTLVSYLEGIPLAIELAAARTAVMTPTQILERLDDLSTLAAGTADDERRRSLEGAIAWSVRLLHDDERAVLSAASLFRGGFDLRAAEAVLGPLSERAIIDVLQRLRERSLLRTYLPASGKDEVRFDLYQSIRVFAGREHVDPEATRRHATHYLTLAEELARQLSHGPARPALAQFAEEQANLRAAIEAMRTLDPVCAVDLTLALTKYLDRRGPLTLKEVLLDNAIEATKESSYWVRAAAERAEVHALFGRSDEALALARELLDPALEDPTLRALAYVTLGRVQFRSGAIDAACDAYRQAEELTSGHDDALRSRALGNFGSVLYQRGEYREAERRFAEAIAIDERAGRIMEVALSRLNFGAVQLALGDAEGAQASYEAALEVFVEGDFRRAEANALVKLANLLDEDAPDYVSKRHALCGRALQISEDFGERFAVGTIQYNIGVTHQVDGDFDAALHAFEIAQDIFAAQGHRPYVALAAARLGAVHAEKGDVERARAALQLARQEVHGMPQASEPVVVHRHLRAALHAAVATESEPSCAKRRLTAGWAIFQRLPQSTSIGVRFVVRRALERAESALIKRGDPANEEALWVGRGGAWFRMTPSPTVHLGNRTSARRLLVALAGAGEAMSTHDLFAAGWPGEHADRSSASNRVRVALTSLRKLGLSDVLERVEAGYRLRQGLRVRL